MRLRCSFRGRIRPSASRPLKPTEAGRYLHLRLSLVNSTNCVTRVELFIDVCCVVLHWAVFTQGVVGVDVYAAPGKPKAFTGEIFVHGIRWKLVDREGAEGSEQMYARINPAGAPLPKL
jgi:hypothetical protein